MQAKSILKTLSLIHAACCSGLLLCAGVVFFLNGSFSSSIDSDDVFVYVVPIVAMAGYFGSAFLYKELINKLTKDQSLVQRLRQYQTANIIKYALIEGPAFLAIVAYFQSGNALFMMIAACLIAYLIFQRPTLEKLQQEIPLSLEDEKEFDTLKP